jgi:hypothetical protein
MHSLCRLTLYIKNMSLITDLQHYQTKRKFPNWEPKPSSASYIVQDEEVWETLNRCLDFLPLELQVAVWDKMTKGDPDVEAILERNAQDETKHDIALKYLKDYIGHKEYDRTEAGKLISQWKAQQDPLVATYALEMGVFFSILPYLMSKGDVYCSIVAGWISDDERIHVETGLRLMKEYKLKLSEELLKLVFRTVLYIFQDKARAVRAVKRLLTGKDPSMVKESLPPTVSFFEQYNRQSIVY